MDLIIDVADVVLDNLGIVEKIYSDSGKKYEEFLHSLDIFTAASAGENLRFWELVKKDESLINSVDANSLTVLHRACISAKTFNIAIKIAEKYPHLVNKRNDEGQKPIQTAAFYGNVQGFWYFIDKDESLIDEVDKNGDTVLHLACFNNQNYKLAEQIADKYSHLVYETNNDGCKPIHITAQTANEKVFKYFIDKDHSLIETKNEKNDTVLHFACNNLSKIHFTKEVTSKNPQLLHMTNNDGCKPIHTAAKCGNANIFWYFIDKDKSLIDAVDENGDTVLHLASAQPEAIDLGTKIAKKYPHLMLITNKNGYKSIHFAAETGNASLFYYFVDKDESLINAIDKNGDTVLHKASSDTIFAKNLFKKFSHLLHKKNNTGVKPIQSAVKNGNAEVFKYFYDIDTSLIDATDGTGATVLHNACVISNNDDLAKDIADKHPHLIQKTDNNGCKPVHTAAENGNSSVFWYLFIIDKSLINAVNENNDTVLHRACIDSDAANLAKKIAARQKDLIHKINKDGCKPIHIAAAYGNADVFWYFIDKDERLVDAVGKDGKTVLHKASAQSDKVDLTKEIADKYPQLVNKTDNDGCLPIHIAAENGNATVFWCFVNKDKNLIDAVDKNGKTVLHKASVQSDAVELAKQIADIYPHLLDKTDNDGRKP